MTHHRLIALLLLITITLLTPLPGNAQESTGTLAEGYTREPYAKGLNLPTHFVFGPEGALYVTELNGGENDDSGRVVRIEKPGAEPTVVLEKLTKPTGIAFAGDLVYVLSRNQLLVASYAAGKISEPRPVFTESIPFNGRSLGQIFLGPDGLLYFQSTGTEGAIRDSGFIYTLKPGTADRKIHARGFKNAYSFAWNPVNGTMYGTEIGDTPITGVGQAPEELNVIRLGGNYGWPQCYADQKENTGYGGNRNICADTDIPLALFPPQNTPTAVAWFADRLIVALFNGTPPRLVSVDPRTGKWVDFSTMGKLPIALIAETEKDGTAGGGLLVLDFAEGTITRIVRR